MAEAPASPGGPGPVNKTKKRAKKVNVWVNHETRMATVLFETIDCNKQICSQVHYGITWRAIEARGAGDTCHDYSQDWRTTQQSPKGDFVQDPNVVTHHWTQVHQRGRAAWRGFRQAPALSGGQESGNEKAKTYYLEREGDGLKTGGS